MYNYTHTLYMFVERPSSECYNLVYTDGGVSDDSYSLVLFCLVWILIWAYINLTETVKRQKKSRY